MTPVAYRGLWRSLALIATGVVVVATLMASLGQGNALFRMARQLPGADKTGHLLLMGGLSFLCNLALGLKRFSVWRVWFLKGSFVVAIAATVEEFSQLFLSRRTFSFEDLFYSYAGVYSFGWLAILCCFLADRLRRRKA